MSKRIDLKVQALVHKRYMQQAEKTSFIARCQVAHDDLFGPRSWSWNVMAMQKKETSIMELASNFDDCETVATINSLSINQKWMTGKVGVLFKQVSEKRSRALRDEEAETN